MYGTPVLGADIGGIPELIEVGKTGELFEGGNAAELKEKKKKGIHKDHYMDEDEPKKKKRKYKSDI